MDTAVDVVPRVNFVVPGDSVKKVDIGSINDGFSNSAVSMSRGSKPFPLSIDNKSSTESQLRNEKNLCNAQTGCDEQEH